jgi:hypothetical protein
MKPHVKYIHVFYNKQNTRVMPPNALPRCKKGTRRINGKGPCVDYPQKDKPTRKKNPTDVRSVSDQIDPPVQVPEPDLVPQKKQKLHFLLEKEREESRHLPVDRDFLYPSLDDPMFNIKIALKKEFQDAAYDGKIHDIEKQANILCSAKFELSPHQIFVKNFLSDKTPYNSLLLYHGLGTGKTCSAIGVAEEMRNYWKLTGKKEKILVVASPNVQDNFRQQLFDEKRLTKITNVANPNEYTWNIESCIGNSLLQEVNPNSILNISREKLVSNVNALIKENYTFLGYIQLANLISSVIGTSQNRDQEIRNIRSFFNGRLLIVDEVHNIRIADDANKELQQVASLLMRVAKYSVGMRLLLLSATPLFNSYKEIVWLTNLLNINDKRSTIQLNDVFDSRGEFKEAGSKDEESGEDLIRRKLTGYVSYVRGENPYTFPYRVWPKTFAPDRVIPSDSYPSLQMNGVAIDHPIQHLDIYVNQLSPVSYQAKVYLALIEFMRKRANGYYTAKGEFRAMPSFENMDSFGYTMLQKPLESLNIVYPGEDWGQTNDDERVFDKILGKVGLSNIMKYDTIYQNNPMKHAFEYKSHVLKKYGRIFAREELPKYSVKMAEICEQIRKSEGIVLIYSQFIDGGIVPMALALEEMGLSRHNRIFNTNLFAKGDKSREDAINGKYIMITGDKSISPSNDDDVKYATDISNKDGSKVKVILISKAGSEGIDFKYVRQIHVLEPWFNMNRIEQIIGRGVRNLSHCALPFKQRNVQIFLHATMFSDSEEESADMYLYRLAERKAKQIGQVTRILKESATDCLIHIEQSNFTADKLAKIVKNQNIQIELSTRDATNRPVLSNFKIGDVDGTEICDYMSCEYQCNPTQETNTGKPALDTFSDDHANVNFQYISMRIKDLYREKHVYTLSQIIEHVNLVRTYPIDHIFYALSRFLMASETQQYVFDRYGRFGYIVNKDNYYAFQPIEISDERVSTFERSVPIENKIKKLSLELPKEIVANTNSASAVLPHIKSYEEIIQVIVANLELTRTPQTIQSNEKNWYMNASRIKSHVVSDIYHFSQEQFERYVVFHTLDTMEYEHKRILFERTYKHTLFHVDPIIETGISAYFAPFIMENVSINRAGIYLGNKGALVLLVRSLDESDPEWREGTTYDQVDFYDNKYTIRMSRLNTIVGYIMDFKGKDLSFYYKDIDLTRNTKGRRCDSSSGKAETMEILNRVIGMERYQPKNAFIIYNGGLCAILEMVLREKQETSDNAVYFLTPEQAIKNKIMDFSRT